MNSAPNCSTSTDSSSSNTESSLLEVFTGVSEAKLHCASEIVVSYSAYRSCLKKGNSFRPCLVIAKLRKHIT